MAFSLGLQREANQPWALGRAGSGSGNLPSAGLLGKGDFPCWSWSCEERPWAAASSLGRAGPAKREVRGLSYMDPRVSSSRLSSGVS